MKNIRIFLLCLFLFSLTDIFAQRNEIFDDNIASLQVLPGTNWRSLPVIQLNGDEPVNIDFDDLTHEYHRFVYKVEHCESDWTPSTEIFSSDYIEGFNGNIAIDDIEESLNTNQLYTHYHFQIPNSDCRLKMSGNYKVTVYDENDEDNPMFTACFMVCESSMGVSLETMTNTDIDINHAHQQVNMEVNYSGQRVTDPASQIKTVVLQNYRWDNARINARPQYVMGDGLRWSHNRDYIFDGGNEYRKFETLDVNHTTMGIERINWDKTAFHAYIWPDEPRPSYVYDEGAKGSFLIRNSDNIEINNTCEYLAVHFKLKSQQITTGDVYLNGVWTHDRFDPKYKMEYDENDQSYNAVVWLKQGYYSYQYLILHDDGSTSVVPSEGNFYQTRNSYQALIYYKEQGGRTDRLVGYAETENIN